MAVQNFPSLESWDPFFQLVQLRLIEPLGLENVIILVDRHQGENGPVDVTLSPPHTGNSTKKSQPVKSPQTDAAAISKSQLTVGQLTVEVQSILDVLLEDCAIRYGDIKFVVNQGLLKETVFSFTTRPHESTASFFIVKV